MMQMWASFHPVNNLPLAAAAMRVPARTKAGGSRIQGAAQGFSLLELLVVLALISFMTALVAPRLSNTVDAIRRSGERDDVIRQLERLPLLARQQGQAIALAQGQFLHQLDLPDGWQVRTRTALLVAGNGYCHAAALEVLTDAAQENWQLRAPDCRVTDAP